MSIERDIKAWDDFLAEWPLERVQQMTLEEYTNPNRDDAFIYWLEKRLETLGSIWGGSAFKFGIYCREDQLAKEPFRGRQWGEKYAWLTKYGTSETEAFANIRNKIVEVIEAVQAGNLVRIDAVDLAPVLKWKIAFIYQDRTNPTVIQIYKKEALFHHYQAIDPTAKMNQTPYSVMYSTLLERHKDKGDLFDIAEYLWTSYEADQSRSVRAWAVPLDMADQKEVKEFCSRTRIEPEDIDPYLVNMLSAVELAEGDLLALMTAGDVHAVGTVTATDGEEYSWDQIPLESFPSGLLVVPQFEVKELTAAEQEEIWSHLPKPEEYEEVGPRYWKIAPGPNAVGWKEWLDKGIASIGFPQLGDLSGVTKSEYDKRAEKCVQEHGFDKKGMSQVWAFRNIKPGDRIVANQGKSIIVGIGTVIEGYRFSPGSHFIKGEDFPHQLKVNWDSVLPRMIPEQKHWIRTLRKLTKEEFGSFLNIPEIKEEDFREGITEVSPKKEILPCNPNNIILYGPPGTGKTYSTARRALELILPEVNLEDLSDQAIMRVFREKQALGQVEFVTFHQAYGYEEFVEGLRPVLDSDAGSEVKYELHNGVFKRIALRAAAEGLIVKDETPSLDALWSQLLKDIDESEDRVVESISGKKYVMQTTSRGSVRIFPCEVDEEGAVKIIAESSLTASKTLVRLIWDNRKELGPEPEKITSTKTTPLFAQEFGGAGGHHYTALWIAYREIYQLSRSASIKRQEFIDPAARVQKALDQPSAGGASFSFSANSLQYVLIIDEINRGNISKILGEMITLLEPDKRIGMPGELKLPLSYSPAHRFAVPPNLHVIGTMNTADRSIALMDVALRRRFTFEELMPDAGVIRQMLEREVTSKPLIDLIVDIFEAVNARIRFVYDRDHQLGHAYFLGVHSLEDLRRSFVERVIPLLQEYFYGAWDKICMVLGCPYTDDGRPERNGAVIQNGAYIAPIISATTFEEEAIIGFDHSDYENRLDHSITDRFARRDGTEALLPFFLGMLPDRQHERHKAAFEEVS
ncbi:MAG: AAA family ATPase [Desulforhabdus sp.]|jgi:5-methylcytosine-specific restriction endonuclease McrBC GTP-binding regulatory subunit McrB|nr:AAA family ATPase [Desulforhabdus sp.]